MLALDIDKYAVCLKFFWVPWLLMFDSDIQAESA